MDDAALFLVRVWHGRAGFRASARRLDEEQAHLFSAPEELARHLALTPSSASPDAPIDAAHLTGEKA
jgi:hypothetical protein